MPYLTVPNAAEFIKFTKTVFDAQEVSRMGPPGGPIMHGEVKIGDSMIMLAEENVNAPAAPAGIYLYVTDTDATYKKAVDAGAVSIMEPADQFYGDRNAGVKDFAGNSWWIGTHIEDVSGEEIKRRMDEMRKKGKL